MSVKIVIKPNTYFDSVSLMSISTRANKRRRRAGICGDGDRNE